MDSFLPWEEASIVEGPREPRTHGMKMAAIRVLIVDDHPVTREGLHAG
jgi:hypothetical protein